MIAGTLSSGRNRINCLNDYHTARASLRCTNKQVAARKKGAEPSRAWQ